MKKRPIPGHSPLVVIAAVMMGCGLILGVPAIEGYSGSLMKGVVLFVLGFALMLTMVFFFSSRR